MTIIQKDGSEKEIPDDSTLARTYRALQTAAQRIALNNSGSYQKEAKRNGSRGKPGSYTVTQEHADICKAMPALLEGSLSPNDAMAMLHEYDTAKQRLGS